MIYLKNEYSYKVLNLPEHSNIRESQLIEISGTLAKNIILGNIYSPPRNTVNDYNIFSREFTGALEYLANLGPEILIAGDYNINLLDVHNRDVVGNYFTSVTAQGLIPFITFPTRFSELRGTLIDNFLYKISARSSNTTSGIMIRKFSDHQPYFTCLDLTSHHVKPPRLINICKQNQENILSFKNDLLSVNLLDSLDLNPFANPNDNYNELDKIIQTVKNKHFPRKTIKYN